MKKIAVITGASSGLGMEFAKQLDELREVDEIWLIARREERLRDLASKLKTAAVVIAADLSQEDWESDFVQRLEHAANTENASIEYLINSAGLGINEKFMNTSLAANTNMLDVNMRSLTRICYLAIPFMNKGGKILNIASVAAFMPQHKFSVYAASKAYVLNFSRALNSELEDVTVTAVCPNPMETEFFAKGEVPKGFKKIGVEKVEKVASKAIRRAKRGKDISLQSFPAHVVRFISRILPHNFVLWFERKSDL